MHHDHAGMLYASFSSPAFINPTFGLLLCMAQCLSGVIRNLGDSVVLVLF